VQGRNDEDEDEDWSSAAVGLIMSNCKSEEDGEVGLTL